MDSPEFQQLFTRLLSTKSASTYVSVVGGSNHGIRENLVKSLLTNRRMPTQKWSDATIEWFLHELSCLDSNNFEASAKPVGLGEREARIYSTLIQKRHWYFGHGIGRSGDLSEVQPKAPGSSIMQRLTNYLVTDAMRLAGLSKQVTQGVLVVPMCTGMALCLCMQTLRPKRPKARFVIWSRVDQKSCFKSIFTAGYEPLIVSGKVVDDQVVTDEEEMRRLVQEYGPDVILAVMTTTSCFAPRVPDSLVAVTKLCQEFHIPHIINNAYGVQSTACVNLINQAWGERGKAEQDSDFVFVQSTDKNFMVPVGGAVISSPQESLISQISATYPGRASAAPIMDLFVTLLSMGQEEWMRLLKERKQVYQHLANSLQQLSSRIGHGMRVLNTRHNDISFAVKLPPLKTDLTFLGSKLYTRFVSGTRVVPIKDQITKIQGHEFVGWMSHTPNYTPCEGGGYLNAASALGISLQDVQVFIERLSNQLDGILEN